MGRPVQVNEQEPSIFDIFLTQSTAERKPGGTICPTGEMIGDFMTKPKQGHDFRRFRNNVMGIE